MFGPAHVWSVAATNVVRSAQEISPSLLLQGPGQVSALHSEEKIISLFIVIVSTVLVNYPLDVAAFFYFHPWL